MEASWNTATSVAKRQECPQERPIEGLHNYKIFSHSLGKRKTPTGWQKKEFVVLVEESVRQSWQSKEIWVAYKAPSAIDRNHLWAPNGKKWSWRILNCEKSLWILRSQNKEWTHLSNLQFFKSPDRCLQ